MRYWTVDQDVQSRCGEVPAKDTPASPFGEEDEGIEATESYEPKINEKIIDEYQSLGGTLFKETFQSPDKSQLKFLLQTPKRTFSLRVMFPMSYPQEPPSFELHGDCESRLKLRIQKALERIAAGRIARGKLPILNHCLKQVETIATEEPPVKPGHRSSNVPYPRTSGARFSHNGLFLVTFGRHYNQQLTVTSFSGLTGITPRALSDYESQTTALLQLDVCHQSSITRNSILFKPQSPVTSSSFDRENSPFQIATSAEEIGNTNSLKKGRFRVRKVSRSGSQDLVDIKAACSPAKQKSSNLNSSLILPSEKELEVKIYNVASLFSFDKSLADEYVIRDDPIATCTENATAVKRSKRLVQVWGTCVEIAKLADQMASLPNFKQLWTAHPFGGRLLKRLIQHHIDTQDYQTAAMIIATFTPNNSEPYFVTGMRLQPPTIDENGTTSAGSPAVRSKKSKFWFLKPGVHLTDKPYSPYHTIASGSVKSNKSSLKLATSDNDLENLFRTDKRSNSGTLETGRIEDCSRHHVWPINAFSDRSFNAVNDAKVVARRFARFTRQLDFLREH